MAAGNVVEDNSLHIQPNHQLKKLRKRPRLEGDRGDVDASLEALRSYTKGMEATVEKLQTSLAEREAEVTVREVASISAEARLAQKSAYLESYEARLRDWEARMRTKAAALQQWQAGLQDQQERLQRQGFHNKEISSPDDTDDELEPMQLGWQHQAVPYKRGQDQFLHEDDSNRTHVWKQDRASDKHVAEDEVGLHHKVLHQQPHEKLRVVPLSVGQDGRPRVGLRIVRSSPPPDSAAALVTPADSPSECSARAAAVFPADELVPSLVGPSLLRAADAAVTVAPDASKQQEAMSNGIEQVGRVGGAAKESMGGPEQLAGQGAHVPAYDSKASPEQCDRVLAPQHNSHSQEQQMLEQLANAAVTSEHVTTSPARNVTLGIPPKLAWKQASDQAMFHNGAHVSSPHPGTPTYKFGEHSTFPGQRVHHEPHREGAATPVFTKALDYKSCDHIMCLTKDMARHLFPPAPLSSGGGPTQVTVDLEDDSGRLWPMTYRCVPHRYSYELRAGWKAFASFWNVGVGDTVLLWRSSSGSLRISLRTASSLAATCPAAATRHAAHHSRPIAA